jgi:hypothetical protein
MRRAVMYLRVSTLDQTTALAPRTLMRSHAIHSPVISAPWIGKRPPP